MYVPPHFAIERLAEMHRVIRTYPLGVLVTATRGLDANHIPFLFDADRGEHGTLVAHVARANPVWRNCPAGTDVLVVFRGVDGYISPTWYPSKHETHRQVPTWNYEVVHAYGVMTVHDDESFVRGVVRRLSREHEASEPQPWKMADTEPEYMKESLARIVGIEIAITALVGKAKLSQDEEERDFNGAADMLERRGRADLAGAMRDAKVR